MSLQVLRTGDFILWKAEDEEGILMRHFSILRTGEETFRVSLKQLGMEDKCQVYDMWSGEDLGEAEENIEITLKSHDAKLYRLKY